jgi:hypothetical protein
MVISEAMPFLFCAQQQISHARLNGEIIWLWQEIYAIKIIKKVESNPTRSWPCVPGLVGAPPPLAARSQLVTRSAAGRRICRGEPLAGIGTSRGGRARMRCGRRSEEKGKRENACWQPEMGGGHEWRRGEKRGRGGIRCAALGDYW